MFGQNIQHEEATLKRTAPVIVLAAILLPFAALAQSNSAAPTDDVARQLRKNTNEMLAAIAPGKWEVWDRLVDDSILYSNENGKTMTKADIKAEFQPLPAGYSGSIEIEDFQVRQYGDTAIVVHRDLEHETVFGQQLEARYLTTDTWIKRKDGWRVVATQVHSMLSDPPAIKLDPTIYDELAGRYELAPDQAFVVTRDGDKLFGQRTGRPRQELLPETRDVFFISGAPRSRKIFARDAQGHVTAMLDRRDGKDLVWKRVAVPKVQ